MNSMNAMLMKKMMTRRDALKAAAVAICAAGGVSGCGPALAVGRVVVRVAWPHIQSVLSAIVRNGSRVVVTLIVAATERMLSADLNAQESETLRHGGRLILVAQDGVEHEIRFRIEEPANATPSPQPRPLVTPSTRQMSDEQKKLHRMFGGTKLSAPVDPSLLD